MSDSGVGERAIAAGIAGRLIAAGHEALFAGGCVRDRLLGVVPEDYDIATSARPAEVQALFGRTIPVGAAFGVVLVVEQGSRVEVATFREDRGIADGRHPARVRFADARADARRRDFTINGMFEHPSGGEVLDFVGGQSDLKAGLLRSIGEAGQRFAEDRLRMLRAIRFATVLGFRIDPETMAALRDQAASVRDVSCERVRDELTRILLSGSGGRGIALLREAKLLDHILPEVADLDGVAQPPQHHPEGDVLTHTRMLLDGFRKGGRAVAWAALLHDIGKVRTAGINKHGRIAFPKHASVGAAMTAAILRRLRFPAQWTEQVSDLVKHHMDWPMLPKMRAAKRRRFLLRDDFRLHLELHRLDCEACHRDLSLHSYAQGEFARLRAAPPPLRPLLSGHDLIAMGFRPGPAFRSMLEQVMDAQLEERVQTPEQARDLARSLFSPADGAPDAGQGPI